MVYNESDKLKGMGKLKNIVINNIPVSHMGLLCLLSLSSTHKHSANISSVYELKACVRLL